MTDKEKVEKLEEKLDEIESIILGIDELRDGYNDSEAIKRDHALTEIHQIIGRE